MLDIVASYHCMQLQGKLKNQTRENGKKTSFRPDFGPFGPKLLFMNVTLLKAITACNFKEN